MRNKVADRSIKKSSRSVTPSTKTLMEDIRAVVFEKDEFEHREMSILTDADKNCARLAKSVVQFCCRERKY